MRAAHALHVTPPAISNALGRLRRLFGDPLFVRKGRGLVPTPRALELAPRIAAVVEALESALDDRHFDSQTTTRRFVIACSDVDQICSVPRIAAALAREMPRATLQVVSIDQLAASDGLATGAIDCAFAPKGAVSERLHTRALCADEPAIVLRRDHPVAASRLSRAQFNALRHVDVWLVLGRAGVGNQLATAFFERHGLVRQVALVVPGFVPAAMVAAATDMAASMPLRVANELAKSFALRVVGLPADVPSMKLPLELVWHPRTHDDLGSSCFRSLVVAAVGESVAAGRRRRGRPAKASPRRSSSSGSRRPRSGEGVAVTPASR